MQIFPITMRARLSRPYVPCFIFNWTQVYRPLSENACKHTTCFAIRPDRSGIPSDVMVSYRSLTFFAFIYWSGSMTSEVPWTLSILVIAFRLLAIKSLVYLVCIHVSWAHRFPFHQCCIVEYWAFHGFYEHQQYERCNLVLYTSSSVYRRGFASDLSCLFS